MVPGEKCEGSPSTEPFNEPFNDCGSYDGKKRDNILPFFHGNLCRQRRY